MPRKRMIHPETFWSDDFAALSVPARLAFIGLWCHVDDDGRAKDSPAGICAAVFGMDADFTPTRVADLLDEIETVGSLCRYEVDGYRFLHIPSWEKWQRIAHPADPRIPPCPDHGGRPAKVDGRGKNRTSPRTSESYGESQRLSPQIGSQSASEISEVQGGWPVPPVDNLDCEHGVDRFSSCTQCFKAKQQASA